MNVSFSVGIELGTSNSAIAVGDIESGDTKIVEIGQIVGANSLAICSVAMGQLCSAPRGVPGWFVSFTLEQ